MLTYTSGIFFSVFPQLETTVSKTLQYAEKTASCGVLYCFGYAPMQ
jgi:hypothetical protein